MSLSRNIAFYFLVIITEIFLHFVLARPGEFPLTIAPFVLLFFCAFSFDWKAFITSEKLIYLNFAIVALPWINAVYLTIDGGNFTQFFRTYALWLASAIPIANASIAAPSNRLDLSTPSVISLSIICAFVAVQAALGAMGDYTFFNVFGSHQYFGEIALETLAIDDRVRPPGFYLEPSFCAYVVTSLFAICSLQNKFSKTAALLAGTALLLIQSLTGLIGFGLVLLAHGISSDTEKSTANRSRTATLLLVTTLAGTFIGATYFLYGEYIESRFNQFFEVGSSTYYRVAGLIPALTDTLSNHPLGWPLGYVKSVVPRYMIPHAGGYGESIDNGLYLLIFYFGWIGLALVFGAITLTARAATNSNRSIALAGTAILMGCFFNGGILLPEFALLTVFILYAAKTSNKEIADSSNNQLSGYSRTSSDA